MSKQLHAVIYNKYKWTLETRSKMKHDFLSQDCVGHTYVYIISYKSVLLVNIFMMPSLFSISICLTQLYYAALKETRAQQ